MNCHVTLETTISQTCVSIHIVLQKEKWSCGCWMCNDHCLSSELIIWQQTAQFSSLVPCIWVEVLRWSKITASLQVLMINLVYLLNLGWKAVQTSSLVSRSLGNYKSTVNSQQQKTDSFLSLSLLSDNATDIEEELLCQYVKDVGISQLQLHLVCCSCQLLPSNSLAISKPDRTSADATWHWDNWQNWNQPNECAIPTGMQNHICSFSSCSSNQMHCQAKQ